MHQHGLFFFFLLVTTCSADPSDECCKAKTVGDVSYTLSRVITDNDSNFDKAASCINKCVYRKTGSTAEFCFKSGDLMVECNRMSDATMKKNSKMVAESVKTSVKNLTAQLAKMDNFTTVKEKFEWSLMYMPNMQVMYNSSMVMYNSSMDLFNAMVEPMKNNPIAKKARTFIETVESELEAAASDGMAGMNAVIDRLLKELKTSPEEDDIVLEFKTYGLEAAKAMIKLVSNTSDGGENGANLYFDALIAHTNSSNMTMHSMLHTRNNLMRFHGWRWNWGKVGGWAASGAVSGCVAGALASAGPGCGPGAAVGAAAAVAAGVVVESIPYITPVVTNVVKKVTGCFAGDSMIETVFGLKMISELKFGDRVRTSRHEISLFTEFLGWLDRSSEAPSSMLQIRTLPGPAITLTSSHLIFSNSTPRFTGELRTGDSLMHWNGSGMEDAEIVNIRSVFTSGFWAPLTTEGTLLVDGFLASCYASFSHQVSDLAFSPVKMLPRLLLDDEDSQHEDGVRPYVRMVKTVGQLAGLRKEKPAEDKATATVSPFPILAGLSLNNEL